MQTKLSNNHNFCWQWDTGIKLYIDDGSPIVHFKWGNRAEPFEVIDKWVAVPDELLQKDGDISFWTYDGSKSIYRGKISVRQKPRPEDYIYTPTEIKRWDDLDERIVALEKNKTAVLYTEQKLTEEQKAQARENIDAEGTHYGWKPVTYTFYYPGSTISFNRTVYIEKGKYILIDPETASDDLKMAWFRFQNYIANGIGVNSEQIVLNNTKYIFLLARSGVFGEDFFDNSSGGKETKIGMFVPASESERAKLSSEIKIQTYTRLSTQYFAVTFQNQLRSQYVYYVVNGDELGVCHDYNAYEYLRTRATKSNFTLALEQTLMASAPTKDMHIATKKYVDDKTIAPTSNDSLELLAETGLVTPAHQDGVIYTAQTGEIYVI